MTASITITSSSSHKAAKAFVILAISYLLLGLIFGVVGGLQYVFPELFKDQLSSQKTRPLHVYLVISWIFTAAQGGIYYYLPGITSRRLYWPQGVWIHFILQVFTSLIVIISFFLGKFGGREYLEFPPWLGGLILLSWIPFVINFFFTLRPRYRTAPVYYWSWSTGIIFFFITMGESYLWLFDFFRNNPVRDIAIQWKALGSMVGSWNMLVYGTGMYIMEQISGDTKPNRSPLAFFFYFLGLTNLMFNWGHHTYIVPAASWIKTVAYVISMTELLILGFIILQWRKTLALAKKNYHIIPFRLLSFADIWIFLNLSLAIAISVPAWNYYTHGTHITVAHAMGSTIGINTMLLLSSVYFLIQKESPGSIIKNRKTAVAGILITNISLLIFWISLLGSGAEKIAARLEQKTFYEIMQRCQPWFQMFAWSGIIILIALLLIIINAINNLLSDKKQEELLA